MQSQYIQALPGDNVELHVEAEDTNELPLTYTWWCYEEASTYWDFSAVTVQEHSFDFADQNMVYSRTSQKITKDWGLQIHNAHNAQASVQIPQDAQSGDTFHFIVEVSNVCDNPMTAYQRIVVAVR